MKVKIKRQAPMQFYADSKKDILEKILDGTVLSLGNNKCDGKNFRLVGQEEIIVAFNLEKRRRKCNANGKVLRNGHWVGYVHLIHENKVSELHQGERTFAAVIDWN